MLGKLLKYEFESTGRKLLPLYGVLILFAIINKLFIGNTSSIHVSSDFLNGIPFMVSIFIYGFTMAAVFILTLIIIVQRFYKNLLGDEGYLMNTLPVSTASNISSKLITGMFWSIISILVAMLSIFIMIFTFNMFDDFTPSIKQLMFYIENNFGAKFYLVIIEFILCAILQLAMNIMMIYSSISLGHMFNKRKFLLSFVSFIILNIIMNSISSAISFNYINIFEASDQSIVLFNGILLRGIIINGVFLIIYFVITNYILKNKLNLE